MIVVESGRRVRVAWRRGRLRFSEGVIVLREVVSPVCVKGYFVIVVKREGAIGCWRHVDNVGEEEGYRTKQTRIHAVKEYESAIRGRG